MPRVPHHPALVLTAEEKKHLDQLRQSRTAAIRDVQRAQILWRYQAGETVTQIARALKTTRNSVVKWIDKALQMGLMAGMKDTPHKPREAVITDDAKAWVVHLACSKPKDLGYAAELWTRSALAGHVRREAVAAGFPALGKAGKATVQRILAAQELQPHKVRYYLERRDPDFATRMREVLLVYKDVAMENEAAAGSGGRPDVVTVSVDEKPGVQAIANTAPDLPPVPGEHPTFARDHEYVRHGTLSILAGLDLFDGHVIARVEDRHRSIEFIGLLTDLAAYYPPECTIRLILDNHSAHLSKETRAFLAKHPNRFKYVLTPKHGSWLNIVETLFGKMARTFLRHMRVQSKEDLRERILKGIDEINQTPVVHRWKAFQALEETIIV
ncbi:MAG: IS630 family transposase [Verrucomicrobia bacterium]|nr:IS630 family transposase [Verrucomicrobiota bacterium]